MRSSKYNILVRGFTLIEVLLVIVMLSMLLLGSVSLTVKYSADLQWNRLFHRLEQLVLDVNTYALAGLSFGFEEGGLVDDLPDMHHLFLQKGEPVVWYVESRADTGDERKIVFQEPHDLEVDVIELQEMFLKSDAGTENLERVLLTWSKPYAQLSFYGNVEMPFSGGRLEETFELGEMTEVCDENCALTLEYQRGEGELRRMSFDLQKGCIGSFINE
ncbi:MAG: type II secretion system protein [Candidatus Altimarinota bacterium]